jgi:alpha-beta hydrolase superfamily lysophospholipase
MAWLSRDPEELRKHDADPFCMFSFTVCAMRDLIRLQADANDKKWFASIRKDLPILIVSGAEDPVGGYGKGIDEVMLRLAENGAKNVTKKLYPEMRHEILNEINYREVFEDIREWLDKTVG